MDKIKITLLQVGSVLTRSKTAHFQSVGQSLRTMNTTANEVRPK